MTRKKAYELLDKRAEECLQKHGNANAAKSDLYVFGRWEKNSWRARSDAASVWDKDVEALVKLGDKGEGDGLQLRGDGWPGSSHEGDPDEGEHDSDEHDSRGRDVRWTIAAGTNRCRGPAYLAAVPDFFSPTRTDWPGRPG